MADGIAPFAGRPWSAVRHFFAVRAFAVPMASLNRTTVWSGLLIGLTLGQPGSGHTQEVFESFLEPSQLVNLGVSARDRLNTLHVKEGDTVRSGQLLAELDSRVLDASLTLARTAVGFHGRIDAARAQVALHRAKLATLQELGQSGNARPQELENERTALLTAEAQLLEAREVRQLKEAEQAVILAQQAEKKLHSPLDGVVLKIYKEEGELVGGVDQEPVITLARLDPLHAVFHVNASSMPAIKAGQTVQLTSAGNPVAAETDFVSPVIEPQSGTVLIRFRLPNPQGVLQSGSRITYTPSQTTLTDTAHEHRTADKTADQGTVH